MTREQYECRTEERMCDVQRDGPAGCWCSRCGDYEVSAPGQFCAECLVGDEGEIDEGADYTGPDTWEEEPGHVF